MKKYIIYIFVISSIIALVLQKPVVSNAHSLLDMSYMANASGRIISADQDVRNDIEQQVFNVSSMLSKIILNDEVKKLSKTFKTLFYLEDNVKKETYVKNHCLLTYLPCDQNLIKLHRLNI